MIFKDGRRAERTIAFEFQDTFIVSIGDSTASGEGNPDFDGTVDRNLFLGGNPCKTTSLTAFLAEKSGNTIPMNNEPVWLEEKAHRSVRGAPSLAALSVQRTWGHTLSATGNEVSRFSLDKITYASFARSGAEIIAGLLNSQAQPPNLDFIGAGQVEEAKRTASGRFINALLINIGGNDAGFSGVLTDLLTRDSYFSNGLKATVAPKFGQGVDSQSRAEVDRRLKALLGVGLPPGQKGQIEQNLDALKAALDTNLRPGDVYITGYPTGLFEVENPDGGVGFKSCGVFRGPDLDIESADNDLIVAHGRELNKLLRRKAGEFNWHYVDVDQDFSGRGYCDKNTFWVGSEQSCERQGDFRGTAHPNYRGHLEWSLRYNQALRTHTVKPRRGPRQPSSTRAPGGVIR